MNRIFYDVESLRNVFTIAMWFPDETPVHLDVYLLTQTEGLLDALGRTTFATEVARAVAEANPVLATLPALPEVRIYDLAEHESVMRLIRLMGIGVPMTTRDLRSPVRSNRLPLRVKGADGDYDQSDFAFDVDADRAGRDTYLFGYNSYNYDTTMLAFYLATVTGERFKRLGTTETDDLLMFTPTDLHELYADVPARLIDDARARSVRIAELAARKRALDPMLRAEETDDTRLLRRLRALDADSRRRWQVQTLTVNPAECTADSLRTFNDCLFTQQFSSRMSEALCYQLKDLVPMCSAVRDRPHPQADRTTLGALIRRFWVRSGRHLDVARLNEKQGRVGLKRQLGVIGRQIFEDADVTGDAPIAETVEALSRLIAYNASDVINLQYLFEDGNYQAPFDNKKMILDEYPETVFVDPASPLTQVDPNGHRTPIEVERAHANVRMDRLRIDSTSQQIISTVLCPNRDHPLTDEEFPSLVYPNATAAAEAGLAVEPRDVLAETMAFLKDEVLSRMDPASDAYAEASHEFSQVRAHYEAICTMNFDGSALYERVYGDGQQARIAPGIGTCVRYYDGEGNPTSCYAIVSEGGIHGAEYNKALYDADMAAWRMATRILEQAKALYVRPDDPDEETGALRLINEGVATIAKGPILDPATGEPFVFADGQLHLAKQVLVQSSTRTRAAWRTFERPQLFRTIKVQTPAKRAFVAETGVIPTELNPRYAYTSAVTANHEDFSSYYPSLLRLMRVFYNPDLGYDRYGALYDQKQEFGVYQKDPSKATGHISSELAQKLSAMDEDERRRYWKRRRDGVKLMLNAGSGAGDAKFDNPIRMNNNTISMRMIGQLFTWRVGQAQALEGALVPSTNTDGLYTVMDAEQNDRILAEQAAAIGVRIDPERLMLISKDSNNRIEFADQGLTPLAPGERRRTREALVDRYRILSAGGSLSCHRGPSSAKSIDHPAVYDWACAYYLMNTMTYADATVGRTMPADAPLPPHDECVRRAFELPVDEVLLRTLVTLKLREAAIDDIHQIGVLRLFQTMVVSSPSSISFVTARDVNDDDPASEHLLQHYNRVFFVTRDEDLLDAAGITPQLLRRVIGRKVSDATIRSREKRGLFANDAQAPCLDFESNPYANLLLKGLGYDKAALAAEQREPAFNKISGLDDDQWCYVANQDLFCMTREARSALIAALDIDAYVRRIAEIYTNNWRNAAPESGLFQTTLAPAPTFEEA